jgi:hypothetical protein
MDEPTVTSGSPQHVLVVIITFVFAYFRLIRKRIVREVDLRNIQEEKASTNVPCVPEMIPKELPPNYDELNFPPYPHQEEGDQKNMDSIQLLELQDNIIMQKIKRRYST